MTPGGVGRFVVGGDGAQLALQTYNPTGFSLYGTHGKTLMSFQPTENTAITFRTRLQLTSLQPGLVYGMYLYGCPGPCATQHDEIDIELVTNALQPGSSLTVQLNRYAGEPLGAGHGVLANLPAGFDPLAPHDWTIRWALSRIDYFVDGVLLYSTSTHVPQGPMQANEIAWAPDSGWSAAFSASLQPVNTEVQNQSSVALLSSVTVTSSVTLPSKLGISREEGWWALDVNGSGAFEAGIDPSFAWGWSGTTRVQGDWNGDGKQKAGFYIDGVWYLDYNGDGVWDGGTTDKVHGFGMAGAQPVVGDWNGDGKDKIGIYINGFWFLDMNGNGVWDGEPTDKMIVWGFADSTPVIGDWNGDGRKKVGLFYSGLWYLDYNGDGLWDRGTADKVYGFGMSGVEAMVGDWNGDGKEEIGIYIDGFWFLDLNGNGLWDGDTTDRMTILGWSGTTPVVGDWNGDGKTKVGTFINGYWYLDYDGNGLWDGGSADKAYVFGQAGDTPVVGRW